MEIDQDQTSLERTWRVNGSQLAKYIGQNVHLLGTGIQSSGNSLKVQSCDGRTITVNLQAPVRGETNCVLEVIGQVVDRQTIRASQVVPRSQWIDMDMETYSVALEAIHSNEGLRNYVLGY